jgi:hypothetical protein
VKHQGPVILLELFDEFPGRIGNPDTARIEPDHVVIAVLRHQKNPNAFSL